MMKNKEFIMIERNAYNRLLEYDKLIDNKLECIGILRYTYSSEAGLHITLYNKNELDDGMLQKLKECHTKSKGNEDTIDQCKRLLKETHGCIDDGQINLVTEISKITSKWWYKLFYR